MRFLTLEMGRGYQTLWSMIDYVVGLLFLGEVWYRFWFVNIPGIHGVGGNEHDGAVHPRHLAGWIACVSNAVSGC